MVLMKVLSLMLLSTKWLGRGSARLTPGHVSLSISHKEKELIWMRLVPMRSEITPMQGSGPINGHPSFQGRLPTLS